MDRDKQSGERPRPVESVDGGGADALAGGAASARVLIDDAQQQTLYVNVFRTSAMAEELMLDVGVNSVTGGGIVGGGGDGRRGAEVTIRLGTRLIMNYHNAKRLALALGRIIRDHESAFGPIELDAASRRAAGPPRGS